VSQEVLLFSLLAVLAVGVLALVAVTAQRLTGKVTLELDLGAGPLARAQGERNEARALASELRARLTSVSEGPQPLHPSVTRDVTPSHVVRTVPLNPEAVVTAHPENGPPFRVPQEPPSSGDGN
jgi:hypothetical protein